MSKKRFINIAIVVAAVTFTATAAYFISTRRIFFPKPAAEVNSFEECKGAGYPIAESYPRQCLTLDGRNFVEKLTIEAAKELLSQSFLGKHGIVGVGIWECNGEPCIKVMLKEELEDAVIPSVFYGYIVETEVPGLICTQELKICPGGSAVGRNPARSCKFDPCPEEAKDGVSRVSLREGQRESSFLLKNIYPDRVSGLNFWEYPVSRDEGAPITLRVGEVVSNGCTITLTLLRIEGKTAVFSKKTDFSQPCPICLAGDTLIETPSGSVSVKDLQVGMPIWTIDKSGERVSGAVQKISSVPAPPAHQMIRLVFDDGRELLASPGHPTADGRVVGDLAVNDVYDGARVVFADRVTYGDTATYDILPYGGTGFYWANDILLGSTLR